LFCTSFNREDMLPSGSSAQLAARAASGSRILRCQNKIMTQLSKCFLFHLAHSDIHLNRLHFPPSFPLNVLNPIPDIYAYRCFYSPAT
jgi:hypothetical protein